MGIFYIMKALCALCRNSTYKYQLLCILQFVGFAIIICLCVFFSSEYVYHVDTFACFSIDSIYCSTLQVMCIDVEVIQLIQPYM